MFPYIHLSFPLNCEAEQSVFIMLPLSVFPLSQSAQAARTTYHRLGGLNKRTSLPSFYSRGVKLIFTGGHISPAAAFKGLNVISSPYQLRYSYIYTVLKLFRPFDSKHEADVAPGENEFDSPVLETRTSPLLGSG